MKKLALIGLLAALAATGCASDKATGTATAPAKPAAASEPSKASLVAGSATSAVLSGLAASVRKGTALVGGEYSLDSEEGRFHRIHAKALGMKCTACHANDSYPENFLYLRKAEFPMYVDGEKVKAVNRAMCIGCHSDGSVATPFYNFTKK
jgi:hypothetical protein